MSYIISGVLLFLSFIFSFSKKNTEIFSLLLMIFAWVIFWGNLYNPDYVAYSNLYYTNSRLAYSNIENGYIYLVKLGNYLGLSYQMFLMIVTFICYMLIHSTVKRYASNFNVVYLMYFIFPFFIDVVQIRNFIMMSILIYSIKYLVDEAPLKYFILILLASTFHNTAFIYLTFLLINKDKGKLLIRAIVSVSFTISMLMLLNSKQIPFINYIIVNGSEKLNIYLETKTNYGFLLYWCLQIISFLIILITKKLYFKYTKELVNNSAKNRYMNLIYWINIIGFLYYPMYLINSSFLRLIRNILILNYIAFSITYTTITDKYERNIYIYSVYVYVLILFAFLLWPDRFYIIKVILENNTLF